MSKDNNNFIDKTSTVFFDLVLQPLTSLWGLETSERNRSDVRMFKSKENKLDRRIWDLRFVGGLSIFFCLILLFGIAEGTDDLYTKVIFRGPGDFQNLKSWRASCFLLGGFYRSYWFACLTGLICLTLLACTVLTQFGVFFKRARLRSLSHSQNNYDSYPYGRVNFSENKFFFELTKYTYHFLFKNKDCQSFLYVVGRSAAFIFHFSFFCLGLAILTSVCTLNSAEELLAETGYSHIQNLGEMTNINYFSSFVGVRSNAAWEVVKYGRKTSRISMGNSDLTIIGNNGVEKNRKRVFLRDSIGYKFGHIGQVGAAMVNLKGLDITRNCLVNFPLRALEGTGKDNKLGCVISSVDPFGKIKKYVILYEPSSHNIFCYNKKGVRSSIFQVGDTISFGYPNKLLLYDFGLQGGFSVHYDTALSLCRFTLFFGPLSLFMNFLSFSRIWKTRTANSLLFQRLAY